MRDAQGNPLAIYDNAGSTINWKEQDLYGSSRLGTWTPGDWMESGNKQYELTNHLDNVLATISDRRVQVSNTDNTLAAITADVNTAQDYYPFGMQMPGRSNYLELISADDYHKPFRYGFNGKENDDEVKHDANGNSITGGQQDYGMRIYDPRIGRFLSVDPISKSYPELTPYQFASNSPITNIDIDGLEASNATVDKAKKALIGVPVISKAVEETIRDNQDKAVFDANNLPKTNIPKINPFSLNGALIAVWYLFTSPNDHHTPSEVYKQYYEPERHYDNVEESFNTEMVRQKHFSPEPINLEDVKKEDNEKKEYYIHYTNRKNIVGIATTKVILPSSKNKIYLTKVLLTEKEVENLLFIGDPSKKGYGKYMTIFRVDPDQASNIQPVPGNVLEYVHQGGSLRIRTGNLIYIGPNVKPN